MKQDPINVEYSECQWCGKLRPVTNWCTCPAAMEAQENLRREDSSFHFRHKRDQTPTPFSLVERESGEVGPLQDASPSESRSSSPRAHTTGMSESRSSSTGELEITQDEKQAYLAGYACGRAFALAPEETRALIPLCPDGKHLTVSTGDPCWCGSDNCVLCVLCGDVNHD